MERGPSCICLQDGGRPGVKKYPSRVFGETQKGISKPGAGNEARTRYLHLGKVALYQMSYARENSDYINRFPAACQGGF